MEKAAIPIWPRQMENSSWSNRFITSPVIITVLAIKSKRSAENYERMLAAGIRIPRMVAVDMDRERIVKEYISGKTVFELVRDCLPVQPYVEQVREMAALAKAAGLNIDYFPTNFVVQDGLIWYVDYECNAYMDAWNFENWGIKYWSRTPEFEDYLRTLGS